MRRHLRTIVLLSVLMVGLAGASLARRLNATRQADLRAKEYAKRP
jgi:hypothetical protein